MSRGNPADGAPAAMRVRVPSHVVYRELAAETVVLDLETGQYHGLDPTGGRMLEVLERNPSVAAAAAELAGDLGRPAEQIEAELLVLCRGLLKRGLIQVG